ncbi:hypothetical protein DMUE_6150, partial [Dictyocoela muelleri]
GKNRKMLPCIDSYLFYFSKQLKPGVLYWRCSNLLCNVFVYYHSNGQISLHSSHNHPPNLKIFFKMQTLDIVKRLIYDNPSITANQVFDKASNCLSEVYLFKKKTLGCFLSFSSCKSIIYILKKEFYPSSARLLSEHVRPELFNLQNNRNIFMHHEFKTNSMLILREIYFISRFASQRIFRIYMDETFKSYPNEFYQIYTIHGDFNVNLFQLCIIFLGVRHRRLMRNCLER